MRPDEHKKRKNTQYKKKHGLSTQGNKTDSKSKNEDGKKPQDDQKNAKKREETASAKSHTISAAAGAGSDDEELDRQFSRRQLVSNWSRYDDIPSDDDSDLPSQRGEDFNKLLAAAGGSAAQFRFKDEEDWNEEAREVTPAVLSLDLDSIAESLSCVPLHERLGISSDLMSVEQLAEVSASAASYQAIHEEKYPSLKLSVKKQGENQERSPPVTLSVTKQVKNQEKSPPVKLSVTKLGENEEKSPPVKLYVTKQSVLEEKHLSVKPSVTKFDDKNTASKTVDISEVKPDTTRDTPGDQASEDEIKDSADVGKDHSQSAIENRATTVTVESKNHSKIIGQTTLASHENVINPKAEKSAIDGHVEQSSEIASLEDDLDMLLGLDDTEVQKVENSVGVNNKDLTKVNTEIKVEPSAKESKLQGKKADENLEDWLDSMLDD